MVLLRPCGAAAWVATPPFLHGPFCSLLRLLLLVPGAAAVWLPGLQEGSPGSSNLQGRVSLNLAPEPGPTASVASAHDAGGPSFCVIARVTREDLPYMGSFLRHYARLGVKTIYLFNKDLLRQEHAEEVQYLRRIKLAPSTQVELLDFKNVNHDDPLGTEELVAQLKEDYVINVDSDEFWVLPGNINDLQHLLQEHPADIYYMRWVMVVDDNMQFSEEPPLSGTVGNPGKYMVNRTMLSDPVYSRSFGHHTVPLKTECVHPVVYGDFTYGAPANVFGVFGRPLPAAGPFVPGYMAHLWGRSFMDTFLRIALRRRADGLCRPLSEHAAEINERLATLAFLSLNEREPIAVDVPGDFFEPDGELEHRLALEAACERDEATAEASLKRHHKNYLEFKGKLGELMQQGSYPMMWPMTPLTIHLLGLSVTDWLRRLPLNVTDV